MTKKNMENSKKIEIASMLPQWDGLVHRLPVRVYYEDTDAGGIVYHSCYVNFAERGRTEYLRSLGYEQQDLAKEHNVIFAVRSMTVDFLRPAVLDDLLTIETRCVGMKGASFLMRQLVLRGDETLVELEIRVASVSMEKKPKRVPKHIVDAIQITE